MYYILYAHTVCYIVILDIDEITQNIKNSFMNNTCQYYIVVNTIWKPVHYLNSDKTHINKYSDTQDVRFSSTHMT